MLLAVASLATAVGAEGPPAALVQADSQREVTVRAGEPLRRARAVRLNAGFTEVVAETEEFRVVRLALFDDVDLVATRERVDPRPNGFTWFGRVVGRADSSVVLAVTDGVLTGSAQVRDAVYLIRYAGEDAYVAEELDPGAAPREAPPIVHDLGSPPPADRAAADDGSTIDVLVVYTPAARAALGGTAGVVSFINFEVVQSNRALENSAALTRLRLVRTAEVSYVEANLQNSAQDMYSDQSRLVAPFDGYLDEVHALRDAVGADLVALVVAHPQLWCGVGSLMKGNDPAFERYAFSTVSSACRGLFTPAHEWGHNIGLNHARDDPQPGSDSCPSGYCGSGAFAYSFAYKDPANGFRTIMAYECSGSSLCPRVAHFSNPDVTYAGHPTGVAAARADAAHNAQSINDTRLTVASFRKSVGPAPGLAAITGPLADQVVNVSGITFSWLPVAGAAAYDMRIWSQDPAGWTVVFSGSMLGESATSTLISLPAGSYMFTLRACLTASLDEASCGTLASRSFSVQPTAPSGQPSITFPAEGALLSGSTQTLRWTAVTPDPALPTMTYEVSLLDRAAGVPMLQISVPHPQTSTIVSLKSSPQYELFVRACQAACGAFSNGVRFAVSLGGAPAGAPSVTAAAVSSGSLSASWTPVAAADLYQVQVVQPAPAGPGGGALTVAARQVSTTSVTLPVPPGAASVYVWACNGDGCGPPSAARAILSGDPAPTAPAIGSPMAGTLVAGPSVLFTWSRVPADDGSNTTYRLFVQDLSRQATALDVLTRASYYAAYFKAEGARYDAIVVANPGCAAASASCSAAESVGPAVGFNVAGTSAAAPTLVQPAHQSVTPLGAGDLRQGNILLGWSPVSGATLYEYFVAVRGLGQASVRGVTPGLFVQVPLTAVQGAATVYSGIVRACPMGATCVAGSDEGWGPWSVNAGPGVTNFTVLP